MIWIFVTIGAILFFIMREAKNARNQEIINLLKEVLFLNKNSEEEINKLAEMIFREALKRSNKNVSFEYITDSQNLINDFSLLSYASVFRTLKTTITDFSYLNQNQYISNKDKVAKETYESILEEITRSINKI